MWPAFWGRLAAAWARLRAPSGGVSAASPGERFVRELVFECEQVARFRGYSGLGADDEFWQAIAAVRQPRPPPPQATEVLALQKLLAARSQGIAFSTLAALKRGWDPCRPTRWSKAGTVLLAAVATLLVFFTGTLTYIYNDGVAIVADLKALEPAEVRQSYDRYIREMLQASRQADEALAPEGRSAEELSQFDLARNVYYDTQTDVSELSRDLRHATARAKLFTGEKPVMLIPLAEQIACGWTGLVVGLGKAVDDALTLSSAEAPLVAQDFEFEECVNSYDRGILDDVQTLAASPSYDQHDRQDCPGDTNIIEASLIGVSEGVPDSFRDYAEQVDLMATELFCRDLIAYLPTAYPEVTAQLSEVSAVLTPLAVMFLPALYGAMGAIMSLMRVVIEPLTPGPSFFGTVHRVTFGAIAGVVLVWFFTPDSDLGRQIGDIGLSLFGLTFLVGFSLDFFFSILDRFVRLTSTGEGRMGPASGK